MRKCRIDLEVLKKRRDLLKEKISSDGDSVAFILPSNQELVRNYDVHYPFRQDSSFYYFTGFEEPDSLMLYRPGAENEFVLFVRPKDPLMETWEGFRFGPEGAEKEFAADKAYLIGDIDTKLPELLKESEKVYYTFNVHKYFDSRFLGLMEKTQKSKGRGATRFADILDPSEAIGELRLIKDSYEIDCMRKASQISAQAHLAAMKFTKPEVNERQVESVLNYIFKMGGAAREAYSGIVASGHSATTLHYNFNDQECFDGDLLLIDAGAEFEYYAGDITRTFPVNGKFTSAQKSFYNTVLEVQKEIIDMIRPGLEFTKLQETTVDFLVDGMLDLGLLEGDKKEIIESKAYKKYYPHGVSHFLGMDVHDTGSIQTEDGPRKLAEGMCFTVEPGLYVPLDDESAPEEFRGMGVRIEDDILVTEGGCENMTAMVPKEVDEIEEVMAQAIENQL